MASVPGEGTMSNRAAGRVAAAGSVKWQPTPQLQAFANSTTIPVMPFYRFTIHGRDPRHADDVRGFFTTRHAYAATQEKAAEKVLLRLRREFTNGASASIWNSDPPIMSIEDGWPIGIHQLRSAPNKGSTFYEP